MVTNGEKQYTASLYYCHGGSEIHLVINVDEEDHVSVSTFCANYLNKVYKCDYSNFRV